MLKPVDPEKDMGAVEGRVFCEDLEGIHVGLLREYRAPAYGDPPSAPMYGRRIRVDSKGKFFFDKIAPGIVYLYVDREVPGEKRPLLLTWGVPIQVSAGKVSRVEVCVPKELKGRDVEEIDVSEVTYDNHSILLKVKLKGKLNDGEVLRAHLYYAKDFFKPHRLCLATPLAVAENTSNSVFVFKEITPGEYVAVAWLDVNDNGRLEPGVDKMSKPVLVTVKE